jgi:hypothetical protein
MFLSPASQTFPNRGREGISRRGCSLWPKGFIPYGHSRCAPSLELHPRHDLARAATSQGTCSFVSMYRLIMRQAIDNWVFAHEELRPLCLSNDEWKLLDVVADILEVSGFPPSLLGGLTTLQIFTKVTLQMSRSSTPTLPWVLPMYEGMLKHLRAWIADETVLESVRMAATAGLTKLETYYVKARGCQFNVIATSTFYGSAVHLLLNKIHSAPSIPRASLVPQTG